MKRSLMIPQDHPAFCCFFISLPDNAFPSYPNGLFMCLYHYSISFLSDLVCYLYFVGHISDIKTNTYYHTYGYHIFYPILLFCDDIPTESCEFSHQDFLSFRIFDPLFRVPVPDPFRYLTSLLSCFESGRISVRL